MFLRINKGKILNVLKKKSKKKITKHFLKEEKENKNQIFL